MAAYYNEIDPFAAQWLRELIKENLIAPGDVDERSIEDVLPSDLGGYTQCHLFAGIGGWSYALRQAGWPDDRPTWTGSCPCQPFSSAGKGKGFSDERHLWPAFYWLIRQCQPQRIFGEQVAGKAGEAWLDLVSSNLEDKAYAVGAAVTAACGFGAPHQRRRLYWVADAQSGNGEVQLCWGQQGKNSFELRGPSIPYELAHPNQSRLERRSSSKRTEQRAHRYSTTLRNADEQSRATNGFWQSCDWIPCRDKKYRPVEPSTFPLVDGPPAKVGRLRGYGNAIVIPQAQAFIEAFIETQLGN